MSELIKKARPKKKARYVCMEGADELVWSDTLRQKLRLADNLLG